MAHEHHHEHSHEHHHEHSMGRQIAVIVASALLLAAAVAVEKWAGLSTWQLLLVYLVPYLVAGHETLHEAVEGLCHGDVFNEHFLMTVATAGALAIGFMPEAETEFTEAVFVMLFFQVGELFEGYAEGRSRHSIEHLLAIRPDVATLADGSTMACREVPMGTAIIVRPGERIPIDAVVTSGESTLNTSALTGESLPRSVGVGDLCPSGCVNQQGLLQLQTVRRFSDSTASRIISLVEDAAAHKSRSEHFITRFARIYTPVVVIAALLLAFVPPLATGQPLLTWVHRALIFLVVSCPCALVISVPLTFFGGIGAASRQGILIKGANHIDTLAHLGTVVFDKTGTLTEGRFTVVAVHAADAHELLHLAAHVEHYSTHPIGAALREAFPEEATDGCPVTEVEEVAGEGVSALVGGKRVSVGNSRLMDTVGAAWKACHHTGTIVHVAIDGQYAGHIVISDTIKADSADAIGRLTKLGVTHTVMLTGDRADVAADVAGQLGIGEHHAELLPDQKATHVERLLGQKGRGTSLAFVGDGINDAPVLARADVGIAMGALGSDAAIEAADVVLMDDKPSRLATAVAVARRTLAIARQNVVLAIGIKLAVLLLATMGMATMWMAVFADVGVTVIAVFNAMRALRVKKS